MIAGLTIPTKGKSGGENEISVYSGGGDPACSRKGGGRDWEKKECEE